ncbi:MAG: Do family serine endopeptidase, partial [Pseudomonadota bacterium]
LSRSGLAIAAVLAAVAAFLVGPAAAQSRVPASAEEVRLSFAPVVADAAPAVVNVYASRTVRQRAHPFADDPFFRRFFGDDAFGMPRDRVQQSLGSGVIVRPGGVIVTNNHVIKGGDEFKVVLADRREYAAELVLADERTDLAVLRIDAGSEPLPFIDFANSDTAEVGDIVLAIGNPFGVGQTVTNGIVSALARTQVGITDYQFFIQTDAAINPGNSGGALVGVDGKLLGVNTAIFSRSGGSNGIGFAIPANMVARVVAGAVEGGAVARPWLGASTQSIDADIAASLGLDRPRGVLIKEVYGRGPADQAGLKRGDIVLKVDEFDLFDDQSLRYRVATKADKDVVALAILRDQRERTVNVRLALPPEDPPRNVTELDGRHPLSGATVANLSPAFAEETGRDVFDKGVVVTAVAPRSIASRYRFRRDDKILTVNGRKMERVRDLDRALGAGESWSIELDRGGRILSLNTR